MSASSHSQIVITINGPGEVTAWLRPLGKVLQEIAPDVRVAVALMPCVFASGAESDVVKALPFVNAVCTPAQTRALAWFGRLPEGFRRGGPGVHLHLGGDPVLSRVIGWRLGLRSLAYMEHHVHWARLFDRTLYSGFTPVPASLDPARFVLIGDMMVDAMENRRPTGVAPPANRKVVLYPGSRDYIVRYLLPFMAKAVDVLAAREPDIEWSLSQSRFLSRDFLMNMPRLEPGLPFEADDLTVEADGDALTLVTSGGNRIKVEDPDTAMFSATVAVTLPGTTTGELAAIGKPMVVVLPTYLAETAPLPGIAGKVGRIPVVGRYIKRGAAHLYKLSMPVVAHANLRSGKMLVPEVVGRIKPYEVADAISAVLSSDMQALVDDLKATMGPPGAARRLAEALLPYLEPSTETDEAVGQRK